MHADAETDAKLSVLIYNFLQSNSIQPRPSICIYVNNVMHIFLVMQSHDGAIDWYDGYHLPPLDSIIYQLMECL